MSFLPFVPPLAAERLSDDGDLPLEDAAIAVHAYGSMSGEPVCIVTNRRGEFIDLNPVYVRVIDSRVVEALATATVKLSTEREPEQVAA